MDVPSPPPAAAAAFAATPAPAPWSAASTGPPQGAGIRAADGPDFAALLAADAPGNDLPPDGNLLPLVAPWAPLVTPVTPGPPPAASTVTLATGGVAGRAAPLPAGPYPALPPAAAAPSAAGGWSTFIGPAGPVAPPDSVPSAPAAAAVPPPPVRADPPPAPGANGAAQVPWPLPATAAGTDAKLAARTPPASPPTAPPAAVAPAPQAAGGVSGSYPAPSPDPPVFTASSPPAAAVSTGSSADPAAALASAAADPGPAPAPVAAGGIAAAPAREAPPAVAMQIAEPPGSEAWSRGLGERVVVMADRDLTQARIALNPPQLGPLEVRVHVSGDQASVTFTAHSQLTRDAIEQALPRLRDMLGGQGFTQVDVNVSQHSFSERSPAASAWARAPSDGLAELPDVAAEPSRRAPGGARLDLYA